MEEILKFLLIVLFLLNQSIYCEILRCPYETNPAILQEIKKVKEKEKLKNYIRPKISVILPVYNALPFLIKCLLSLSNQTIKEAEFLIIDDGSTDGSSKVIDFYAEKDKRMRVFHIKNAGVSCARNLGLEFATGEYFFFLDADDFIHPEALKYDYIFAKKDNVDILRHGSHIFKYNQPDKYNMNKVKIKDSKTILRNKRSILFTFNYVLWRYIFKRELIKDHNITFIPKIKAFEDGVFAATVAGHAKTLKKIKSTFYFYRMGRPGAISTYKQKLKYDESRKYITKRIVNDWRKGGILKGREHDLLDFYFHKFYKAKYFLPYAKQVLYDLGPELINETVIRKCDKSTMKKIRDLLAASQPKKINNVKPIIKEIKQKDLIKPKKILNVKPIIKEQTPKDLLKQKKINNVKRILKEQTPKDLLKENKNLLNKLILNIWKIYRSKIGNLFAKDLISLNTHITQTMWKINKKIEALEKEEEMKKKNERKIFL